MFFSKKFIQILNSVFEGKSKNLFISLVLKKVIYIELKKDIHLKKD